MRRVRAAGAALCLLALSACAGPVPEPVYSRCGALGSSDWKAELLVSPSAHKRALRRRLAVSGKVIVPAGASADLEVGPVAKLDPPVQQVLVRTPGAGGAAIGSAETPAVETRDVSGVFPALKRYGGVEIRCGDGIIARIAVNGEAE